jgi:hypothetical protein
MKLTPWYFAAIAPIAAAGCSGTLFGHVAVLAVTLGIFIGTLSLGRAAAVSAPLPVQTTSELEIPALDIDASSHPSRVAPRRDERRSDSEPTRSADRCRGGRPRAKRNAARRTRFRPAPRRVRCGRCASRSSGKDRRFVDAPLGFPPLLAVR